jgi:3-hydroxyacyl-CoA dehydrogenase/enoyl-CoA hydratase/3-hydroxybutyryl-CoA epimerase
MSKNFKLNIDERGIATLIFDIPGEKVNKLSLHIVDELGAILDELKRNQDVKVLVIKSSKPGIFIAGADLNELSSVKNANDARQLAKKGHVIFNQLEALPFPSIAVIDGVCLGGGLEMALACTYRVVTDNPKVKMGLPETTLGIIPGWGGTQRLPRLVGLTNGLDMILSGKQIDGKKAFKMNLADALMAPEFMDRELEEFIRKALSAKGKKEIEKKRNTKSMMDRILESPVGRPFVFRQAFKELMKKTKGHYPAPIRALGLIQDTFAGKVTEGLEKEIEMIVKLIESPVCKNLMELFFISEDLKKDPGLKEGTAREIGNVGVLGAGIMGGGIAWLFSDRGHNVRLKDIDWNAIAKGYESAYDMFSQSVTRKKMTPISRNICMHKISGTVDYKGFDKQDLVVEAVTENFDLKVKVLRDLEEHVTSKCIIASNTSSLSITQMAKGMKHPERFVGLHFFNPVNRMPLVEVIAGEKTDPGVVVTMVELMKKCGKTPIVVKDCSGFLVNRLLIPAVNEAGFLFEEGVPIERVDSLIKKFGMPMGPFELGDEVGIDVIAKAGKSIFTAYGSRMKQPTIFESMMERKFLGKKVGSGFFTHKGEKREENSEVKRLQSRSQKPGEETADQEIVDRFVLIMVNEAARCLEENVVKNARYLDMAMLQGSGFPPFRGGLMRHVDSVGAVQIVDRLRVLADKYGERFEPAPLLKQYAKDKKKFYGEIEQNQVIREPVRV